MIAKKRIYYVDIVFFSKTVHHANYSMILKKAQNNNISSSR